MTPARFAARLLLASAALTPVQVIAQTPAPDAAAAEARPTGLPPRVDWTFNFDATWGSFGFANSLFINPKEGADESLSDQWFEGPIGRRPDTSQNEAFDPLLPGFHELGTWWQGEIAGEYFLGNSNLKSHLVRAGVTPSEAVEAGLLFYDFTLDQPASFGAGVTDKDVAFEVDAYTATEGRALIPAAAAR